MTKKVLNTEIDKNIEPKDYKGYKLDKDYGGVRLVYITDLTATITLLINGDFYIKHIAKYNVEHSGNNLNSNKKYVIKMDYMEFDEIVEPLISKYK